MRDIKLWNCENYEKVLIHFIDIDHMYVIIPFWTIYYIYPLAKISLKRYRKILKFQPQSIWIISLLYSIVFG